MEENRDPRREGAMETLREIDQATARIDALIARAGGPMVICRNVQESDAVKRASLLQMLYDVADYRYDGDLLAYPAELVDTIDRLEAALANALLQRDQLIDDLRKVTLRYNSCSACGHGFGVDEVCLECSKADSKWVWRGVQEGENDGSKN